MVRHLDDIEALLRPCTPRPGSGAARSAPQGTTVPDRPYGPAQHTRWAPHLVLLAAQPSAEDALRLAELAADASRLGIGYLVAEAGDLPGAAWEMEITRDGKLLAPLLGLELEAQLLPASQQRAVVELFTDADPEREDDGPTTTPPFLVDISEKGRPAVYARLVGSYEIIGLDAPRRPQPLLHEALALLLLHREGVHPRCGLGLWPRGVTRTCATRCSSGCGPGWAPTPTARRGPAPTPPGCSTPQVRGVRPRRAAVALRRGHAGPRCSSRPCAAGCSPTRWCWWGTLLADRPEGRYGWLTHEIIDVQLPLLVADIGLALSAFHLEKHLREKAIEALNAALRLRAGR